MMRRSEPGRVLTFTLVPTAQQLAAAVHATPFSLLLCHLAGLGGNSGDHPLPFQRAAKVTAELGPVSSPPTAMHAEASAHQTPVSAEFLLGPPFSEMDQAEPFHRCARIPLTPRPTDMHAEPPEQDTS
jgi:hypothetical protein